MHSGFWLFEEADQFYPLLSGNITKEKPHASLTDTMQWQRNVTGDNDLSVKLKINQCLWTVVPWPLSVNSCLSEECCNIQVSFSFLI